MAGPASAGSIWTGANSNLWNDAANWNGGVPVNGDTHYFDLGQSLANLSTNNDMVGLTNLFLAIDKSGVTISGNAIGLGSAGITATSLGSPTLNVDLSQPGDTTYSVGSSRSITLNGVVSGTGGLIKAGGGTLFLNGANTYSGGTTVSAGTLQGSSASLLGSIANNAVVRFDQGFDGTYAGVMSGTGSLAKSGAGTLTLSGANTYTGGTTVSAGRLQGTATSLQGDIVNNGTVIFADTGSGTYTGTISGTGSVFHNSGATTFTGAHTYSGGTSVNGGYLTGTTTSLQGDFVVNGNLTFDQNFDGTFGGNISGTASAVPYTGGLTKTGTGTVILTGTNTYNGGTRIWGGTLQGNTASLQGNLDISLGAGVVFDQASAGTYAGNVSGFGQFNKTGAGTLTLSGTNTYSGGTTVSAGTLQGSTTSLWGSIANNAAVVFDQATDGTYGYVMSGTGSLTKIGNGTLTLSGANTYSGGTTVSAGTLQGTTTSLQGSIANNAAVVFDQGADGTYAGVMSGTGSLTKSGAGTLTLTGANTYSGGTLISGGTLQGTTTSLQGNIANNAAVVFDQAANGSYAGIMSGTGSLTKSGTGTVALTGANTYSGGTAISGGTLAVGADNNLGAAAGGLTLNGGTLQFDGGFTSSRSVTLQAGGGTFDTNGNSAGLTDILSGAGGLTKTGAGTLTLSGTNTYSGGTTVSAGTLQGSTASLQGNIANNAAVVFDQAAAGTYAGVMSGTGSLTKTGSEKLILSGANTYSGGTTVSAGTLQGTTTSLQGDITNNAAVVFDQGTDGTYAGVMSGTGSLTKTGNGTVTLTGNNSYSGGTTVGAGTLRGTTASLKGDIANDGAVVFDQGTDGTYAGVMSGTGNFSKIGAGILNFTGANTYTGDTTINGGTLAVNGSIGGPVFVGIAGTLGGTGTMGNVDVYGRFAPGNSIGTISTGNLAFIAGSVYEVEVDAAGNSDRTNVTGTVSLGNATLSVLAANGNYSYATDYLIIDNDGGDAVTGTFGTLTSNLAFLDPSVNYAGGDGNDVLLSLTRNDTSFSEVAQTSNQRAVAAALEETLPGASGDMAAVITAVTGLSAAGARSAYDQMGGAGLAAFYESDLSAATRTLKTVSGRLASLRKCTAKTAVSQWDTGPLLASNDALKTTDAGPLLFGLGNAGQLTPDADWGVWGRGLGVWGDRDGRDVAEQYDYRITGVTLGLDRRLGEAMVAGISVGYAGAELDYDQLEDSDTSWGWEAALYGARMQGPWYVDAMAAYAHNDYDTKRRLSFGGVDQVAKGDFDGDVWSAYLESGRTFDWQGLLLQPLASLQVVYMDYASYTETGAGALNLVVDDGDATSVMGSVGLRLAKVIAGPDGGQVVPEARVRWAHEFSHDERVVSAGFAGAPSGAGGFKMEGDDPVRDRLILGCGLTALYNDAVGVYLNYDAAIGDDALDQAFSGGLRVMW